MSPLDLDRDFERFREQSDLRALSRVFDAAAPQLLAVARHLAPSRGEAEDLLQATFVVAIERAASWDRARPVLPWLLGILAFEARKARARAGREPDPRRLELRETLEPSAELGRREVRVAVDAALARLPETYAPIVRRHLLDGASPSELAVELGLTPVNARTRLHRGLRILREAMPRGFAGLGIWLWCHWSGPRAARGPVLRRASELVGRPAPLPFGSLALVATLVGAPLAWLASEFVIDGAPRPMLESAPRPERALVARLPATPGASERSEPPSFPIARVRPAEPRDRMRGRLLRHDGAPAVGVSLELQRWGAESEQGDTPFVAATTDDAGQFDFEVASRPDHSLRLVARVEEHAPARWWFPARDPGSTYDAGEVRLERATTLTLRIVDGSGAPMGAGWQGVVEVCPVEPGPGIESYFVREPCDPASGIARFGTLPAREVRVSARHVTGHVIGFTPVDPTQLQGAFELVYDGPRPEQRVAVSLRLPRGVNQPPALESISLECPQGLEHAARTGTLGRTTVTFDGVEAGAHVLRVEDPLFEPVELRDLHAGSGTKRLELCGSAVLHLQVLDALGAAPRRRWKLSSLGAIERPAFEPYAWAEGAAWPTEGVRVHVVPIDARMRLELEGALDRDLELLGLKPGETRSIAIDLRREGHALEGRVVPFSAASIPSQRVRLVRGDTPPHARAADASVVVAGAALPAPQASVLVDSDGSFRFDGLEPGRWTVATEWGPWLGTFATCELPLEEPLVLEPPPHGTVAGTIDFPPGARTDHVGLLVRELAPERAGFVLGTLEPGRALEDQGRFLLGCVPTGELELLLAVTDHDRGSARTFAWPLARLQVEAGVRGDLAFDARAAFPASVTVAVTVDGAAREGDSVSVVSRVASGTPTDGKARVMQAGWARVESLGAGTSLDIEYMSSERWRARVVGLAGLRFAEERREQLAFVTAERRVSLRDQHGHALAQAVELRWLTGTLVDVEPTIEELLWCPVLRTDSVGRGNMRLPLGRVRVRAPQGWRCEPEWLEWAVGEDELVLSVFEDPRR